MFISPAYAQGAPGGADVFIQTFVPMLAIMAIFYFLIIRPQQARLKTHREMVANVRRGDTIVMSSGMIGKVKKATDGEADIDVEIAPNTVVKVVRATISDVRGKGEAPKDAANS